MNTFHNSHQTAFESTAFAELWFASHQSVDSKKNVSDAPANVKDKLQQYVAKHTSAKDKRLLENHVHCFILLS